MLVDGELVCPATPCDRAVPRGRHTVEFQKERYHPASRLVELDGTSIREVLRPRFALLSVRTSVEGLSIAINGQVVGAIQAENWRAWDFAIVDDAGSEVARIT